MDRIRYALIAGCVLFALACVGGAAASGPSSGGSSTDNHGKGGDHASKLHQAVDACKAQGLKPGTDAFRQCVKSKLPTRGAHSSGQGDGNWAKLHQAVDACKAQGLKPRTDAFKQCVKSKLPTHP
jgi:hypothetical protein